MLRWDVEHVKQVYLDGQGVVGHSARKVCPPKGRTYVLHVVYHGGTTERRVTIKVPNGGSPPPQQPGGNQPGPFKANAAVTDLFAKRLRGGKLFARITNHGPGTLKNARARLECNGAGWKGGSPVTLNGGGLRVLNLGPGQTAVHDTGITINVDHFDYYEITCRVQAHYAAGNSYSESVP